MKRALVVVGLILLAAALVFLKQGMKKAAVPDEDEDQQAQKTQTAQKQPSAPVDPKAVLLPEETIGDPATAKHHITVGWVYNEANQQKPETLTVPLQAIRNFVSHVGGSVSAEIVNLDVPLEDRTPAAQAVTELGIQVDGKSLYGNNLSDSPTPQAIFGELSGAIKKK